MNKKEISIYCVDDDRISRMMMEKILEDYQCISLESGYECLQLIQDTPPDLILLEA